MSDNTTTTPEVESSCTTCVNSIRCNTWGEVKCLALKKRISGYKTLTDCKFYKKREKDFKESPCQCKDCLKNERLNREQEE